jgi:prephenate dehydratase
MKAVGYQGVPGAYSSIAATQRFPRLRSVGFPTFDAVIQALREKTIAYGMLPIENSTSGRIADIHNLLHSNDIHIVDERFLPIHHCLIGTKNASL